MDPIQVVAQYVLQDAGGYRWAVQRRDGRVALGATLYPDATQAARAAAAAVRDYAARAAADPVAVLAAA
jgi:hypothetical protein